MSRGWKIAIALLAALAILLAVNAYSTSSQTKEAEATVPDGRILSLSRGDVQVTDSGAPPADGPRSGQPIVLIHCYTCSLRWYDAIAESLAGRHRVVRIDLLGHGGSEKPESGYEIPNQAAIVAEALAELEVQGALVVGHSMGASVVASLAEQASQLVDRAAVIGMGPNTRDYGDGLPLTSRISRVPVLGQALWRITPDFVIRDGVEVDFAPGYDFEEGFADPDTPVEDIRAMTYTAYEEAPDATAEFADEAPLDQRFAAAAVPLLVILGAEDQIVDAERAAEGYSDVPGVRSEIVADAGHAVQVERPGEVTRLLESFAVPLPPPSPSGRPTSPTRRGDRPSRSRRRSDARRDGGRAGREPRPDRPRRRNR